MRNLIRIVHFEIVGFGLLLLSGAGNAVWAQVPARESAPVESKVTAMEAPQPQGSLDMTSPADEPKPIDVAGPAEPLETRMLRKITLDIRDMNIVDVVKFLAVKGEFNVVTSATVEGRATLLLKSVAIKDALDISVISNNLAYQIQNDIVHVMSEAEYEAMYGKKFSDKRQVEIIRLNYAKPSYVLSALDSIKSNIGKIIIDEDTGSVVLIDTPEAIARMKTAILSMEKPVEVFVYKLQYAKAETLVDKLKARIDANAVGSLTANERTNQIVVRALPERRKEIEELIKSLDEPTKEVLVEARVMQVSFTPNFDAGIDWSLDFIGSSDKEIAKLKFDNVYMDEGDLSTPDNLASLFGRIGVGTMPPDHFEAAIRALKQVRDTKILSNPKILVTNNEEAKIHIGDTVPYIISTTSGTGDNAITSEDVRFVDVGLKLNVTPTINDDGFVLMRLKPEISTVVGTIASQGGGIPQVNKTLVETSVLVKDGTTIILGGLKKDEKVHQKKGFPVLMDVPFLDKLFSRTTDSMVSTEIVIFITPHIVTGKEHFEEYKGDIKPWQSYEGKVTDAGSSSIKKDLVPGAWTIKD